ncbi:MAG: cob(I)yrinic acid a,c-diamide adenosyltransferase [Bryobacterales bacterium]|jgi:cob(I)alamin adenosyltransferase|nr:cob(I)yrinic acid a,c-diamide adenosyltransferase [Bryobacterales bacterium]
MSITTRGGDEGRTSLPGGERVSKADPRVECYGAIDELVSQIGFARSICEDAGVKRWLEEIQRDLFKIGESVSPSDSPGGVSPRLDPSMIEALDDHVRRVETAEGLLKDWALPGSLPSAAALDVARAVCRRTERLAVQLADSGLLPDRAVLAWLNRLSDVLWLFARLLEHRAGAPNALRRMEGGARP